MALPSCAWTTRTSGSLATLATRTTLSLRRPHLFQLLKLVGGEDFFELSLHLGFQRG